MKTLIFGLSGQVGKALLPKLLASSAVEIIAFSRQPQLPHPSVQWHIGELGARPDVPADIDVVFSLGPLDAFADWFNASTLHPVRVIALSSTGIYSKVHSSNADECAVAERLVRAETTLTAAAANHHATLTILRPTLVYGHGHDRSLTPLVAFAKRWRFLPLPMGKGGLRQPVHVDDVAQAVLSCMNQPATQGKTFDLPGAETLTMMAMIRRVLTRHARYTFLLRLPNSWLQSVLKILPARFQAVSGFFSRWQQSQVFDAGPAEHTFGYRPRPFTP